MNGIQNVASNSYVLNPNLLKDINIMHDFKSHIEFAGKLIMNSDEGSDLHHVSTIVINDEATVCNYQS
ncbi:hypothetical protein R5P12_003540, partial [Klebsiella aerogenes]|nr:hypothetical protein [Klebsiella aerogenes]